MLDDHALDSLIARIDEGQTLEPELLLAIIEELRACRSKTRFDAELRPRQEALVGLAHSEAIGAGDLNLALREIAQVAANFLDVQRSSVWR